MGHRIRRSGGLISIRWHKSRGFAHGCVVGLSNQTIIVLVVNLNDRRTLRVETGMDWQCSEESCRGNGDGCCMDHSVGGLRVEG
jgi:hypothetical protein